jgi:hypothetical protein
MQDQDMNSQELIEFCVSRLKRRRWNWSVRLIFNRPDIRLRMADNAFSDWMAALEEEHIDDAVFWFRITDRGINREYFHFHIFIGGLSPVRKYRLIASWQEAHLANAEMFASPINSEGLVKYIEERLCKPKRNFGIDYDL